MGKTINAKFYSLLPVIGIGKDDMGWFFAFGMIITPVVKIYFGKRNGN